MHEGRKSEFTKVLQSFRRAAIAAVAEDVAAGRRQCLLEVRAVDSSVKGGIALLACRSTQPAGPRTILRIC